MFNANKKEKIENRKNTKTHFYFIYFCLRWQIIIYLHCGTENSF